MYGQRAPSGTSLVLGRWGKVAATPPGEQQLLERLQAAASDTGCRAPDVTTSVYIGLKIGSHICIYSPERAGAQALAESFVATITGLDSEQVLRLHGPLAEGMAQRYAAVRLNEFVAAAVDGAGHSKAWFVLADMPADPAPLMHWLARELRTALRSAGVHAAPNLFVLLAAGACPPVARGWLCVPLRRYKPPRLQRVAEVPPVGYQRQLLHSRLTGAAYRKLLRDAPRRQRRPARRGRLAKRWLAASRDAAGRGLWRAGTAANQRRALLALRRTRR